MLCACHGVTLGVQLVQSTTQRALSQVVQGYVGDDDDQYTGEDQGGPPCTQLISRPVLLRALRLTRSRVENQPTEVQLNLANVKAIEETLEVSGLTAAARHSPPHGQGK
jgi:hypothetical protein